FGGLLRERLVGEHARPDTTAALDRARERDAGGFDLAGREPRAIERLQAEVAERERAAPPRRSATAALLHLAPLDLLRGEHGIFERASDAERRALLLFLPRQHLAAEDPDPDADDAVGGAGLGEAVVHVGAQRVQRYPTLAVPLPARDLGAAEPAGRLDADA